MHILHRRRQLSGLAAAQFDERLLHGRKQKFRISVAVGGNNVNAYHRVRLR